MDITDQVAGLREALASAKYGGVSVDQRELEDVLDRVSALEAEREALREQEPVAFLCLLTNEDGEILLRRFRDAAKTFTEGWTVFGLPGRDYSEEFSYTEQPLYAAPVPPAVKESLTTADTAAVPTEWWEAMNIAIACINADELPHGWDFDRLKAIRSAMLAAAQNEVV